MSNYPDDQVLLGVTLDFGFDYPSSDSDPRLRPWEVRIMQEKYLVEQIKLLNDDRSTAETRKDALGWISEPLVVDDDVQYLGPLSFQRCCREGHGVDPFVIQERVLREVAPDRLAALGYE